MNIIIRKKEKRWAGIPLAIKKLKLPFPQNGEVTVLFANDKFIKKLNYQYRGYDKPTNILSFPNNDNENNYLGDIVLAFETILNESIQQNKSTLNHCVHLVVHGILHLLGYDHEENEQATIMEQKEIEILASLNIDNPYNYDD